MEKKLAVLIFSIILSAFYTSVLAQNPNSNNQGTYYGQSTPQQYLPQTQNYRTPTYPSYDYRYHAYQNYERAAERYMSNPTRHNYQVMEQRRQIWEMREKQYQQYKK
mgnify:CR=1 FL=1